jgi:hypothetical protein
MVCAWFHAVGDIMRSERLPERSSRHSANSFKTIVQTRINLMKAKNRKRFALALILIGMGGVAMTVVGMLMGFGAESSPSVAALAQAISSVLAPATIGASLVLTGLAVLLIGWWRGRGAKCSDRLLTAEIQSR